MTLESNILTDEQKETLLNYLDSHLKDSGFHKKIEEKLDSLDLSEKSNIEQVYNEIHSFMTNNMPQNVQDAFFADIKRIFPNSR